MNAARVRSLTWNEQFSDVDEDIWSTIALYRPPTARLLPNLRKLDWRDSCDSFAFVNLFLSPTVVDLTLGRKSSDELLDPILNTLPFSCPHLERLRLVDFVSTAFLSRQTATSLLEGLPQLRIFECDRFLLPGSALYVLGHMQFLKEATIATTKDCLSSMMDLARDGETLFPAILRFRLHLDEVDSSSLSLVRRISSCSLREFVLSANDPPKRTIVEHLHALCEKEKLKLRKLSLSFPKDRSSQPAPKRDRSELTIDMQVFEHIFAFPKLLHLHVTSYYLDLDNNVVKRIVEVFPKLKSLRLLSNYYRGSIPRVTMEGVTAIAHGCKHLQELAIAFDTISTIQWTVSHNAPYNTTLRLLEVGDSPIITAGPVAVFITAIFANPALEVLPDAAGPGENRSVRQQYANMWRDVQRMVMYMATAREQERARLRQQSVREGAGHSDTLSDSDDEESSLLL